MSRKKIKSALMAFTPVSVLKLWPVASWRLAEETYKAKSTVFAVCCAHGHRPVIISRGYAPSDGLLAGQHYLPGVPTGIVDTGRAEQTGEARGDGVSRMRLGATSPRFGNS
jgi:hypothetical protein